MCRAHRTVALLHCTTRCGTGSRRVGACSAVLRRIACSILCRGLLCTSCVLTSTVFGVWIMVRACGTLQYFHFCYEDRRPYIALNRHGDRLVVDLRPVEGRGGFYDPSRMDAVEDSFSELLQDHWVKRVQIVNDVTKEQVRKPHVARAGAPARHLWPCSARVHAGGHDVHSSMAVLCTCAVAMRRTGVRGRVCLCGCACVCVLCLASSWRAGWWRAWHGGAVLAAADSRTLCAPVVLQMMERVQAAAADGVDGSNEHKANDTDITEKFHLLTRKRQESLIVARDMVKAFVAADPARLSAKQQALARAEKKAATKARWEKRMRRKLRELVADEKTFKRLPRGCLDGFIKYEAEKRPHLDWYPAVWITKPC